jgi:hypothetical protein
MKRHSLAAALFAIILLVGGGGYKLFSSIKHDEASLGKHSKIEENKSQGRSIASDSCSEQCVEGTTNCSTPPNENLDQIFSSLEKINTGVSQNTSNAALAGCQSWTVRCLTPAQIDAECPNAAAFCSAIPCTITYSTSMCSVMGLTHGQQIPSGKLPDYTDPRQYQPEPDCRWKIERVCIGVHESQHGVDWDNGGWTRGCQTEINAFQKHEECLQYFFDRFCLGNPQNPKLKAKQCAEIKGQIKNTRLGRDFNLCICSVASPASAQQCTSCVAACISAGGSQTYCNKLAKAYCEIKPTTGTGSGSGSGSGTGSTASY